MWRSVDTEGDVKILDKSTKFLTSFGPETVAKLRQQATERGCNVQDIIRQSVDESVGKSTSSRHQPKDFEFLIDLTRMLDEHLESRVRWMQPRGYGVATPRSEQKYRYVNNQLGRVRDDD